MDVVAARFADFAAAMAARDAILVEVAMPPADVAVRPLGTTQYDHPLDAVLLAGRFEASVVALVRRLVNEHGGTIIARRTESKPRVRPASDASGRRTPARRSAAAPRKRLRRPVTRLRIRAARDARLRA